jgi:transcriptional regulator with XRE-family HTH domain
MIMLDLERIGNRICTLRTEAGLSQEELALKLFVTRQAVSKWERGRSMPAIDILSELTELFGVSLDFLLDQAEYEETDYEGMLKSYPRDAVITKFFSQKDRQIERIFYLLSKSERRRVIDGIIFRGETAEIIEVWPYLSPDERDVLFASIISGNVDFDLNLVFTQLSRTEQMIAMNKNKEGVYPYRIIWSSNGILSERPSFNKQNRR